MFWYLLIIFGSCLRRLGIFLGVNLTGNRSNLAAFNPLHRFFQFYWLSEPTASHNQWRVFGGEGVFPGRQDTWPRMVILTIFSTSWYYEQIKNIFALRGSGKPQTRLFKPFIANFHCETPKDSQNFRPARGSLDVFRGFNNEKTKHLRCVRYHQDWKSVWLRLYPKWKVLELRKSKSRKSQKWRWKVVFLKLRSFYQSFF